MFTSALPGIKVFNIKTPSNISTFASYLGGWRARATRARTETLERDGVSNVLRVAAPCETSRRPSNGVPKMFSFSGLPSQTWSPYPWQNLHIECGLSWKTKWRQEYVTFQRWTLGQMWEVDGDVTGEGGGKGGGEGAGDADGREARGDDEAGDVERILRLLIWRNDLEHMLPATRQMMRALVLLYSWLRGCDRSRTATWTSPRQLRVLCVDECPNWVQKDRSNCWAQSRA